VPNHQVGRITPLEFRGDVAMSGNLGYELDLGALGPEEKAEVAQQVAFYKSVRSLVQFGSFVRILSPFEGNAAAWIFVSRDKAEAWAVFFRPLAEPNASLPILRLKGLDPEADYQVSPCDTSSGPSGVYGGDELMSAGFTLNLGTGDSRSCSFLLKRA
jgi:alpha-galactosidase